MDLVKIPSPNPFSIFLRHSQQGRAVEEQWYSVILIKTVSFIALCRFTVVGWKRSFHDNPPPRIYRAKNNRNWKTVENGYDRPTRINCVRRHIRVLSRGFTDKMAKCEGGGFACRCMGKLSWSFATVTRLIRTTITIRKYVLSIIDLELQ